MASTSRGHASTPTAPAASAIDTPPTWHPRDTAAAAFGLRADGASEAVVRQVLDTLAAKGIRNPAAYLRARTEEEREDYVLDAEQRLTEPAHDPHQRRGDLMEIRTRPRWKWRTSGAQVKGVDCG